MNRPGERLVFSILKHPTLIITSIFLFTVIAFTFVPRIRMDNTIEAFFDKESRSYIAFQEWKDQFGDDQFIVIAFADDDIFTEENLTRIASVTKKIESLEYVHEVTSLTSINDIIGSENDFIVERLIKEVPSDSEELEALKKRATENPLYLKNIISKDGRTAGIMVELENLPDSYELYRKEVMQNVRRVLKGEFSEGKKYYISGPTAEEFFYTRFMQQDLKTFLPLALIVIVIVLFFSFRKISGTVLPLSAILITLAWTMFFFYILGFTINNATTLIPPIVLAIVLADSIHFVSEGMHRKVKPTIEHLALPCFLTSLTTAIGFFSLMVSRINPIKELGLVAGVGILLAYGITFTLLPALIGRFGLFKDAQPARHTLKDTFDEFMVKIGNFNKKFNVFILIAAFGVIILSFLGLSRIKVETNVLEYFKKESYIYKSTDFINDNLSGTYFLEISLKAKGRDYFKEPESLRKIEGLQEFLQEVPQVDKATSVVDYIKEINKSFHNENSDFYSIPPTKRLVAQYLLLYGATDLNDYVDSEWEWATVQARLSERTTSGIKEIIKKIEDYLNENFQAPVETEILGWPVLDAEVNDYVTKGQIQSLGLAMLVIFGIIFIIFRSLPVGMISIVPNALPILINFGLMGILGIRLDTATSMISAIGIGIIVDDTIHFLHNFGQELKKDDDYTNAMYRTLSNKGRPIVLTSVILFFGFGVVTFSKFMPTVYFGLLSALMMLTALLADLIVLPALLLYFKPRFRA
jgi:hydrophobe/amphiphile efflux-3 (HAE3) family protein